MPEGRQKHTRKVLEGHPEPCSPHRCLVVVSPEPTTPDSKPHSTWGMRCSRAPSTKTCPNSPRFAQNLLSTQSEAAKYGPRQFAAPSPPTLPAPSASALPRCAAVCPSASPQKGLRLSSLFLKKIFLVLPGVKTSLPIRG